jgi:hypothetical protein
VRGRRLGATNVVWPNAGRLRTLTDVSQPAAQGDVVVVLRPRDALREGKAGRFEVEEDDEDYRYRMLTNIIGAALIAILIGAGVWLAHAIADIAARTG